MVCLRSELSDDKGWKVSAATTLKKNGSNLSIRYVNGYPTLHWITDLV